MKEKKYSYGIYNLPPIPTSPPISGWHQFQSHPVLGAAEASRAGEKLSVIRHGWHPAKQRFMIETLQTKYCPAR
jgi:hypothetical protein